MTYTLAMFQGTRDKRDTTVRYAFGITFDLLILKA
jgi:hypothetical protein